MHVKNKRKNRIFIFKNFDSKDRTFCSFAFMKRAIIILFGIFLVWMAIGGYLEYTNHPKGSVVMGLGVLFLSFILMPVFIYWRYRDGKYKKYVIKDDLFLPKKDPNEE